MGKRRKGKERHDIDRTHTHTYGIDDNIKQHTRKEETTQQDVEQVPLRPALGHAGETHCTWDTASHEVGGQPAVRGGYSRGEYEEGRRWVGIDRGGGGDRGQGRGVQATNLLQRLSLKTYKNKSTGQNQPISLASRHAVLQHWRYSADP